VIAARLLHLVDLVMWHRAICILFIAHICILGPALAQERTGGGPLADDIFTVHGLAVDVTADSALAARDQALRDGQRQALIQVLRRLTLRTDHLSLPQPEDDVIAPMVATVAVAGEKTSAVRYLAELTVRFHRAGIRELLRGAGFRFSETRAKPILVLPIFEKGGVQSLFEDGNVWRDGWGRLDLAADSLLPLRLPLGDLKDITTITAQTALAGREEQLRAIATRYNVENVMIAHAILDIDLAAGGLPQIQVNLVRSGPQGKSTEVLDYSVTVGNDLRAALAQLALRVAVDQQEQWKRRTQLSFDADTSLSALVPLTGLANWLEVRKRLAASAMVSVINLQEISRTDAQVVIEYLGDTDSLVISLAQVDLHLSLVDAFWTLRLMETRGGGNGVINEKAAE
jgi:hypothetical protein